MPALPFVANVIKITFTFAVGDDTNAQCRFYWGYTGGPPSATDCATLAGSIRAAFNAQLKSQLFTSSSLTSTKVLDLSSATGAQGVDTTSISGTRAGTGLPAGVCTIINLGIARRYRGGKPRIYLPFGVAGDLATLGHWTPAFVTGNAAAWVAFQGAVTGLTSGSTVLTTQKNVSYFQGYNAPVTLPSGRVKQTAKVRSSVPTPDTVTGVSMNNKPGSQRRRNLTRG